MRLGTETGSLENHLYSRMTKGAPEPEIGMGATVLHWTDRHAATVVAIEKEGKVVIVRLDKAARTDQNGMSEDQTYAFEPDPCGAMYAFKKNRAGQWREATRSGRGRWVTVGGSGLLMGIRRHYHDYSF